MSALLRSNASGSLAVSFADIVAQWHKLVGGDVAAYVRPLFLVHDGTLVLEARCSPLDIGTITGGGFLKLLRRVIGQIDDVPIARLRWVRATAPAGRRRA